MFDIQVVNRVRGGFNMKGCNLILVDWRIPLSDSFGLMVSSGVSLVSFSGSLGYALRMSRSRLSPVSRAVVIRSWLCNSMLSLPFIPLGRNYACAESSFFRVNIVGASSTRHGLVYSMLSAMIVRNIIIRDHYRWLVGWFFQV